MSTQLVFEKELLDKMNSTFQEYFAEVFSKEVKKIQTEAEQKIREAIVKASAQALATVELQVEKFDLTESDEIIFRMKIRREVIEARR